MDIEGTDGVWCSGTFQDEDLGQSAWVHHLVAVQFRAFLILIMVIIRLISIFVESSFQFIRVVFVLLSPVFGLGSFIFSFMLRVWSFVVLYRFTHDVLVGSFSDMIFYLSIVAFCSCVFYISCD